MKCKIFQSADIGHLEKLINVWLKEIGYDRLIIIDKLGQSEYRSGITITIWYTTKSQSWKG